MRNGNEHIMLLKKTIKLTVKTKLARYYCTIIHIVDTHKYQTQHDSSGPGWQKLGIIRSSVDGTHTNT